MRHIFIIIISILLFSYLLVSCQKEEDVLYRWDDGKKGFEWKTFGDADTQPKYKGEISNGKPNGTGTSTYPNGRKYVGDWKDGKLNGRGTLTLPNGEKYVGDWKGNRRHGQGTLLSPDGKKYEGEWKDDKKHGQGTETYPNGSKYVGEFKNGKRWKKLLSGISSLSE